jgi:4-amino-4-deoxy-L-arabinose transferase-like glycosyltransferase
MYNKYMFKRYNKIIIWSVLLIVVSINLFFGYSRLSKYSAVDEPYWTYDRTPDYWNNIKEGDWKGTKINDKPGIMVALISGFGLLYENPLKTKFMRRHVKTDADLDLVQRINFVFRFPIYLVCLTSLLLYYWLIRKMANQFIALVSIVFIGLSPIILGQSLIINPDSLLWIFLPLSIVSYLVYQRNNEKKYLYLAGVMMGFSILTKYVANLLYIFIPVMIIIDYFFAIVRKPANEYLKKSVKDFLTYIAVSFSVYVFLFPATWVNIKLLLDGTFFSKPFELIWPFYFGVLGIVLADVFLNRVRALSYLINKLKSIEKISIARYFSYFTLTIAAFVLINVYSGMKFFNFEAILASPKSSGEIMKNLVEVPGNFFSGYYALFFGLTPVVFLLFLISIIISLKNKNKDSMDFRKYIFVFLLFLFFYYIGSSISGVGATVRYQIVLYPLAMISSAIGLYWLLEKYILTIKKQALLYVGLLLISFLSLYFIKPFYLAYASYFLPNQFVLNLKGMGDGNYEVAQFLNQLPNADQLFVWSDKGGVCESFRGRCIIGHNKADIEGIEFDYFVSSIDRKSKSMKASSILRKQVDFNKLYDTNIYDYRVVIGGRENNFVKAVSMEKIKK